MRYINAYEVTRHYGGPEEGGWWYDAGRPLASIPFETDEEAKAAITRLHDLFDKEYEYRRTRFSVIGEENLEIYHEDHPAKPYPDKRPHYE